MSSYPALLSPLMDNEGLITSTSLNTDAQLALGYALADREDVIVLNETTLRLKGDPATYTGDADSNLVINGTISSTQTIDATQGFYTALGTNSAQVNIKKADNTGYHNLVSNESGLYLNTNLEVGTLKYSALDPAIEPTATPNLEEVLTVSSDGGNKNISNINEIISTSIKTNSLQSKTDLPGWPVMCNSPFNLGTNGLTAGGIQTPSITVTTIRGVGDINVKSDMDLSGNNIRNINNLSSTRSYASSVNSSGTLNVLNQGQTDYHTITANASGLDLNTTWTCDDLILHKVGVGSDISIVNDASNLVTLGTATGYADLQVGVLKYTSLDPAIPPASIPTLGEVLTEGAIASVSIDMNEQSIQNANNVNAKNVYAITDLTENGLVKTNKLSIVDATDLETAYISANGGVNCTAVNSSGEVAGTSLNLNGAILTSTGTPSYFETTAGIYTTNEIGTTSDLYCQNNFSLYDDAFQPIFQGRKTFNDFISFTDTKIWGFGDIEGKTLTSTAISGTVIKNNDSSFTVDYLGNAKVNELTYTSLNPAIPIPSLSDVLISGNSAGINDINMNSNALTNVSFINGIVPQYIPAQEYWVSKSGSDNNIGSIGNPFLTVGKALEVVQAFTDGLPRVINVLQGSYTQNLTITKSRVSILGQNPSGYRADTGCSINGTLLIACTGDIDDMNNNNIYISNLQINGKITNTSSSKNRLSISNCYVYGNSQLIYMNNSNDYRFFANNCTFSNESTVSTNEMLLFSGSGMVSITNCQLTQKGLGNVVHFNGSSRVDTFAQNILTSDSASADAQAILKITSSNTKAIGNCAFIYSSASSKSTVTPKFSCGILMNTPSNSYTVLSLWNNVFSLAGTSGSNSDFAVNQVNANSSVIYFGNNASVLNTNAHNIVGNLNSTKIPFTSVQ